MEEQLSEEVLLKEYLEKQKIMFELSENDFLYLKEKVIIVFGAGGTIGREIVRQLINRKTKQIILVDNNENGIYDMKRELQERYNKISPEIICILGDIRNIKRIRSIYAKYKPNIVFHYANYKSAVLGNISPGEFAKVNIGGTRNLLEILSDCSSIERFIFISSDKAENPSQSYGRTKRINELLVQICALKYPKIKFGSIRYCNVLDAAGSFAISTFRDQIINKKPVTIRRLQNNEIPVRYFIPRHIAAKLAIKVGCECDKGDIFSLDKSKIKAIQIDELVKIIAKKLEIQNIDSWFQENIKFVDSEFGEKKVEELGNGENLPNTPLIRILPEKFPNDLMLNELVDRLLNLCDDIDSDKLIEKNLKEILDLVRQKSS